MWFYYFMLGMSSLMPIMMYIFGVLFRKSPPQNINHFYGYRTRRSKMNQETWHFAHNYAGHIWSKISLILLMLSIFPFIFLTDKSNEVIGFTGLAIIVVQSLIMLLSIILVERALKRNFDDEGKAKSYDDTN